MGPYLDSTIIFSLTAQLPHQDVSHHHQTRLGAAQTQIFGFIMHTLGV
jgi:hypothetical protein